MTKAMMAFVDFLHENKENPRIIAHYEQYFELAHTLHEAESVGFVLDPESVVDACKLILEW